MIQNETDVVALMKGSKTREEWVANADAVWRAYGGYYPEFWNKAIVDSGVAKETLAQFGGTLMRRDVDCPVCHGPCIGADA